MITKQVHCDRCEEKNVEGALRVTVEQPPHTASAPRDLCPDCVRGAVDEAIRNGGGFLVRAEAHDGAAAEEGE